LISINCVLLVAVLKARFSKNDELFIQVEMTNFIACYFDLTQDRGRAPKVHLGETVLALHKFNRKHQLKVLASYSYGFVIAIV